MQSIKYRIIPPSLIQQLQPQTHLQYHFILLQVQLCMPVPVSHRINYWQSKTAGRQMAGKKDHDKFIDVDFISHPSIKGLMPAVEEGLVALQTNLFMQQ